MGMFTNFSKTTHPDNRFEFLPKEKVDEIIIGASCKHVFKIPFSYNSIVKSGKVIYSQGVNTSFAIEITEDMIEKGCDERVIIVKLPVSKTRLFSEDKAGNSTKCQLKLLLKTGETSYDKPYRLKVFKPLDILTTSDSATSIDKADQDQSYTKAEADARFTLISSYEAKIAELEERIKALEDRQTTTEPTLEQ